MTDYENRETPLENPELEQDGLPGEAAGASMEADAVEPLASSDAPEHVDAIPREYVEAPYHNEYKAHETISLNNGALQLSYADVRLPGKNGFDLVVKRVYDSATSGTTYAIADKSGGSWYGAEIRYDLELLMTYMYLKSASVLKKERERNGYTPDDYYVSPTFTGKRLKTVARDNAHYTDIYGLGYGWGFAFPSVEFVAPSRFAEDNKQFRGTFYLHLEDGRSITVERDYDKRVWKFADYDEHDVVLTSASSSSMLITYKDGRQASFSGSEEKMRLQYMEDRFGNRITFAYTSGRLSQITDTMGRVLKLKETVSGSTKTLYWQQEDTGDILFKYIVQDNLLREAHAVTSQAGPAAQITSYEYTPQTAHTTLFYDRDKSADNGIDITYQNLTAIRHPSGARTEYAYTTMYKELASCMRGEIESYVIRSRKDYPTPADKSIVLHEEQYSYGTGEMTLTKDQREKIGTEAFGADYTRSATVEYLKNGVVERRVVSSFESRKGLLSSEDTYHMVSGTAKLVGKRTIQYEFERSGKRKLPISETDTAYDPQTGATLAVTKTWAYDGKDNVTAYTETYPQDASCNQTVTMTYDLTYSLMTGRTTSNTSGTVREEYLLSSDKKMPVKKLVYQGGTLKERTEYAYDAQYRLTSERRYTGVPLASTSGCVVTEYAYECATSPGPTQVQMSGVKDADGSLISSPYGGGIVRQTFTYDWYGRQLSATDANGNTSSVKYDGLGRKVRETNADATFRTTAYDDQNNRITATDENGNATRYDYTPLGEIAKVYALKPDTLLYGYSYDHLGRVVQETAYGANGLPKLTVASTYDLFDRPAGRVTSGAGVDGGETYAYDRVYEGKYSRAVKTVKGDAGAPDVITETVADQLGRTVRESVGGATVSYTYDKLGNKLTRTDPRGGVTRWEYDHAGRVVRETNALGRVFLTEYDSLGRKVKATDPKGHATTFVYDAAGRLLEQSSPFDGGSRARTRYFYDAAGNTLRQETLCGAPGEAEAWRAAAYTYDNRGRVVDAILYEADGGERRSRTVYDAVGNKLEVYTGMSGSSLEGAQRTSYTYNRFGKVTKVVDPRSNLLGPEDELYRMELYSYDVTGRLLSRSDRNGCVTSYAYDGLERVLSETAAMESAHETVTHSYTRTGQKRSEQNAALTVTNAYDARGLLVSQTETGGVVKTYAYDAAGNRTSFGLTRNGTVEIPLTYAYDALNRLTAVSRNGTVIARYTYDENGNRASLAYPESGLTTTYAYNDANLVVSLVNSRGGAVLSSFSYTYYLDGNQASKTDKDGKAVTYRYDGMGRLTGEAETGGRTFAYTYDRFGNRATMSESGTEEAETVYEYHPNNWLLKETRTARDGTETYRYRYDANGNLVYREHEAVESGMAGSGKVGFVSDSFHGEAPSLVTRAYNGFNQMVSAYSDGVRIAYSYRPDGLRHRKLVTGRGGEVSTRVHLWDGQQIVAEVGSTGAVVARYPRGANLIAREQDGALQYYLHNAHGDVTERTDNLGTVLRRYKYDAFGNEQNPEPLDSNPFRFCGEYFDAELGEVYLRARYYDPRTGRFGAEDSARDGLNWYTYCNGNPITFVDPEGKYYIVETGTEYTVKQDSDVRFIAGIPLQFIPWAGNIPWIEPKNTVGGTSHGLASMFTDSESWENTNRAININGTAQVGGVGSERLGAIGNIVALINALDLITVKGEIVEKDAVLFELIKFYELPTSFKSIDDAETQMNLLTSIYEQNKDYLLGTGGTFEGSQFQADMRIHKMKSADLKGRLLMERELDMSTWEVMEASHNNKNIAAQYLRNSQYSKRMQNLWKELLSRK